MEKIDWDKAVEKLLLWQWLGAAVAAATGLGIWLVFGKAMPSQVPIFHSLPWGEEQLAAPIFLAIPLGLSLGIALFCSIAAGSIKKERVLAAIITGSGMIAEIILILSVLRTILLVT